MKQLRVLLPLGALVAGFLLSTGVSFATKEMSKKEKKPCTTCHTKGKELNNVGEYYKEKKSLEGAPAPQKK
jgi:predicted nucleic acid-binding protein